MTADLEDELPDEVTALSERTPGAVLVTVLLPPEGLEVTAEGFLDAAV